MEEHIVPKEVYPDMPTVAPGAPCDVGHERWLVDNIRYRASDIVIATFPKCGTTFMEQIVLLLLTKATVKLDPLTKNSAAAHSSGPGKVWPEACVVADDAPPSAVPPGRPRRPEARSMPLSTFDALPAPRVIKTHAPLSRLLSRRPDGSPAPARYIVVVRNPLDACGAFTSDQKRDHDGCEPPPLTHLY